MKLLRRSLKTLCVLSLSLVLIHSASAQNSNSLPDLGIRVAYPALTFVRPVWMTEAPDGTGRIFVVEQDGKIWILPKDRSSGERTLFFDISDRKPHRGNEEGLLCMAFHPQFKKNGKFYLYYCQQNPRHEVLSEFQVSKTNANDADLTTERVLMEIPDPYSNHNGSTLLFGPDGYLYFSDGDGGNGGDPLLNGQSLNTLLGKILRIDVDSRTGKLAYGIPKDNPFVARAGDLSNLTPFDGKKDSVRPEIWALGLRNAWRFSFDRQTGELWAGDVGQNKFEEVDIIVKGGNYGWSAREAFHPFKDQTIEGTPIDPIIEYAHNAKLAPDSKFPDHGLGISITGGYVYRGKKIPDLRGVYVYGDYQTGAIWGLRYAKGKLTANGMLIMENPTRPIASFGEDGSGELYVLSLNGKIYQLVEGLK